jgi:hypothetical protein
VGWRTTSAIGAPGSLVTMEVIFEADSATRAGTLELSVDDRLFRVERLLPVAGQCVQTPFNLRIEFAIAPPAAQGRYVACRIELRILSAAYATVATPNVSAWSCVNEQGPWLCPLELGAVRVDAPGRFQSRLQPVPAQPLPGQPFSVHVTTICESFFAFDGTGFVYDVDINAARVRLTTRLQESAFQPCPSPEFRSHEFELPGLPAGVHRIELVVSYVYGSLPYSFVYDLADITVSDARASVRTVPTGGTPAVVLLAVFAVLAARGRLSAPARAPRTC